MRILGIESSCDETAVSVVEDGRKVLANLVYSQIARHQAFGGVVPEIASRAHVEVLPRLLSEALAKAGCCWNDLDGIAVTRGPGLATSLLIGATAARSLALALDLPLFGVNHLEGHLYSVFLPPSSAAPEAEWPTPEGRLPMLVLLVTGGHTLMVLVERIGQYVVVGQTLDDAAGEALDKGATLMGLSYPGGPAVEAAARGGKADAVAFPRGRPGVRTQGGGLDPAFCFSYSGLKTSLLYHLREASASGVQVGAADLAASYQEAVFDQLVRRLRRALEHFRPRAFACVGGVARNGRLRELLSALSSRFAIPCLVAAPEYCTDNAAMIAGVAGARTMAAIAPAALEIDPNLPIT